MVIIDAVDVVPESQIIEKSTKKKRLILTGSVVLFVLIVIVSIGVVVLTLKKRVVKDTGIDQEPTSAPSLSPTISVTTTAFAKLLDILEDLYSDREQFNAAFSNTLSSQYRAATWVANHDSDVGIDESEDRIIRRFALAAFYFATNGDEWIHCGRNSTRCDKSQEWLTGANECDWYAIECNDDESHITGVFFRK